MCIIFLENGLMWWLRSVPKGYVLSSKTIFYHIREKSLCKTDPLKPVYSQNEV